MSGHWDDKRASAVRNSLSAYAPNMQFRVSVNMAEGCSSKNSVEISYNADIAAERGLKQSEMRKIAKDSLRNYDDTLNIYQQALNYNINFMKKHSPVIKINQDVVNNIVTVAHDNDTTKLLEVLKNNISDRKTKALINEVIKNL